MRDEINKVGLALFKNGHDPVLVGSACASLYTGGVLRTGCIEFVINRFEIEKVAKAMRSAGYETRGEKVFYSRAKECEVILETPPLVVGDHEVEKIRELKIPFGQIKMLTPTDCVRHRLASYYHFGDKDAFSQAVRIARNQKVDLELIKRWSEWEWAGDKCLEFLKEVEVKKPAKSSAKKKGSKKPAKKRRRP